MAKVTSLKFSNTGYFSSLICNYLAEKPELRAFYNRFPSIENFEDQIKEKQNFYTEEARQVLVKALRKQYKDVATSEESVRNMELLKDSNTFTITTGHQLNLFTGPLYFLYKIVSTINLSKELKQNYPDYNFLPVYWMATEDHDFEEINYFNFKGKKIQWNRDDGGAVGDLSTDGLKEVFEVLEGELGHGKNAETLKTLFKGAYLHHDNLTDATRYLANELFKDYGLVIVDGHDKELKSLFVPYMERELMGQNAFKEVSNTNKELSKTYKIQVNPREINLFYLTEGLRERIIKDDEVYKVNNTNISWNLEALRKELSEHPQRFSPNVIMRPLYQEVILPNLCYIGGGGELAYWFQLKSFFGNVSVPFPILLLRNSVLIQTESQSKKLKNLNILKEDIFLKRDTFINKKVREISNINIDFSEQKNHLSQQFEALFKLAEQTDKSFLGAVEAQEKKQQKGLDKLEKRLLKAQKKVLTDQVSRMTELQNQLFPNGSLQERNTNFSEFYLEYGAQLVPKLIQSLKPLSGEFSILTF